MTSLWGTWEAGPGGNKTGCNLESSCRPASLPFDSQHLVIPNHVTKVAGWSGEESYYRQVPDNIRTAISRPATLSVSPQDPVILNPVRAESRVGGVKNLTTWIGCCLLNFTNGTG